MKKIAITGHTRGIGKAIALLFAKHGANIVFTHISLEDEVTELKNELSNEGVRVSCIKSDASHFESSQNLIDKISPISSIATRSGGLNIGILSEVFK